MKGGALHELVATVLRAHPDEQFTPEQLARILVDQHPDRFKVKSETLGGLEPLVWQLTREIYAQRRTIVQRHSGIAVDLSKRPLKLSAVSDVLNEQAGIQKSQPSSPSEQVQKEELKEQSLYEPLQRFLADEMGVFTKRIRESTSRNRRGRDGNKWLHPDIVGMAAPAALWNDLIRQCAIALPAKKASMVSVEVKVRLSPSNIRECFFQTVSNSLWANQAYLAAAEVSGESTLGELRMLCALHGIGFISIDTDTFSESRVLIPARERDEVDWASAERIAEENKDFQEFLKNVLNYLTTGQVMHRLWDFPPAKPRNDVI